MANSTSSNQNLWCVVYRMGGTDNFTWHRSVAMPKEQAVDVCALTKRGGRAAMVVPTLSQWQSASLKHTGRNK